MTENKRFTWDVCVSDAMFYDNGAVIDYDDVVDLLNEQHETIIDNEEYIKDLEYQLKGFKKDYNDCGEYLKEYQQKVKDTLQKLSSKYRQIRRKQFENQYDSISWSLEAQHCLGKIQAIDEIADELGIDLQ